MEPQKITNMQDFIKYLENIKKEQKENPHSYFIFRGESQYHQNILPSIARNENDLIHESEKIANIVLQNSAMFSKMTSLETLAYLQHFGEPTRMLDVTLNPLVALYFACSKYNEENGKDGYIYYWDGRTDFYVPKAVQYNLQDFLADGVCAGWFEASYPLEYYAKEFQNYNRTIFPIPNMRNYDIPHFVRYIKNNCKEPMLIFSGYETKRQNIQKSAYLFFPNVIQFDELNGKEVFDNKKLCELKKNNKYIIIDKSFKKEGLSYLDLFGINEKSLFPERYQMC